MADVQYEHIRVADLAVYAERAARRFPDDGLVAISRHRARAQAANPEADRDDIGLIVAQRADRCVGYVGLVPGRLVLDDGVAKVHYLSTWNVAEDTRGLGIGPRLIEQAMRGRDLVGTGSSQLAINRFLKMGFTSPSLEHDSIAVKQVNVVGRAMRRLQGKLPHVVESVGETVGKHSYQLLKRALYQSDVLWKRPAGVEVRQGLPDLAEFDVPEPWTFHRSPQVVRWMLEHPWVLPRDAADPADEAYRFTSYAELFGFDAVTIEEGGGAVGYGVFSVLQKRQTIVKLLDHHARDEHRAILLQSLLHYAKRVSADVIDLPTQIGAVLGAFDPFAPLVRHKQRPYFCRPMSPDSPLARALPRVRLQYADADIAFV